MVTVTSGASLLSQAAVRIHVVSRAKNVILVFIDRSRSSSSNGADMISEDPVK
jgi:hypothetical protein